MRSWFAQQLLAALERVLGEDDWLPVDRVCWFLCRKLRWPKWKYGLLGNQINRRGLKHFCGSL